MTVFLIRFPKSPPYQNVIDFNKDVILFTILKRKKEDKIT